MNELIHGLTPQQIEAFDQRGQQMLPHAAQFLTPISRSRIQALMPEGAVLSRQGQLFNSSTGRQGPGSGALFTNMAPYMPEFASPDRQLFPVHRRIANTYWKLFWKMDPVIGAVIELLAELCWGDFQLTGEGVDGSVKEMMEYALRECNIHQVLVYAVKMFLVLGEFIPQKIWNDEKGSWVHVAIHDPDSIKVVHSHLIKMDPIMEFIPDPSLREVVQSQHPMLQKVREAMPPQLVQMLATGQNIPLSPVNATFIARKLTPWDLRGTSILTRLWRTFMFEDAIWSATIATARRAATPVKLVKMGDPATNTLVSPEEEMRLLEKLAAVEQDPQAYVTWNHQVALDLWGAPERLMSINQHYDLIERLKLTALGVSKSLISGEQTYSSAAAGLTVFMKRLKSIRDFFVNSWLIPHFFLPMAIINGWIKPSKQKTEKGQVRVKRSARELVDENLYIIPTIEWQNKLDPMLDNDRISAMASLEQQLGIKISDAKKFSTIGLDAEEEQELIVKEVKRKKEIAGQDPLLQTMLGLVPEGGGGGGGGLGISPGLPPMGGGGDAGGLGGDIGGGESGAPPPVEAPMPEGASIDADEGAQHASNNSWSKNELEAIVNTFSSFDAQELSDHEPWFLLAKKPYFQQALRTQDTAKIWEAVERFMLEEDYPDSYILGLEKELARRGLIESYLL